MYLWRGHRMFFSTKRVKERALYMATCRTCAHSVSATQPHIRTDYARAHVKERKVATE